VRLRLWPRSLAARTALVLIAGLVVVQMAGLGIHARDRVEVLRLAQARDLAIRIVGIYRTVVLTAPADREAVLAELHHGPDLDAQLSTSPPVTDLPRMPPVRQSLWRVNLNLSGVSPPQHWHGIEIYGGPYWHQIDVGLRMPDGQWLNVRAALGPVSPWHSPAYLTAFLLMTVAAGLTLWAVRRLTRPVRTLAAAAEALGRDVNAPPLPEGGPLEVATAAAAFNTMAARIRRFEQDRTELLTAIGHDLRTPITRLKLRAEFVEDEEQRSKMLADVEELEATPWRSAATRGRPSRWCRWTWPSCCGQCWTRRAMYGPMRWRSCSTRVHPI
jgi:signal transduction histidine kinase